MENFNRLLQRIHKKEIIALLILVVAIPISVFLVQKTQELRERAGGGVGAIIFRDTQGNSLPTNPDGLPVSNSLEVQVELNAPAP